MKTYGFDPVKLSDAYTVEQLVQLHREVQERHANPKDAYGHHVENGRQTIYIYDKAGRRKLEQIGWALYHKRNESAG